jgi:Nucleotide-diphospho-sugar transferase
MADRPLAGVSNPRIRAGQSGVRGGRGIRPPRSQRKSTHSNGDYCRNERDRQRDILYDAAVSSSASGRENGRYLNSRRSHQGRPLKTKERGPSASRTWMATAITTWLVYFNHGSGIGTSALQDAVLYNRDWGVGGTAQTRLSVEIFAAPKPFTGEDGTNQIRAIESWTNLDPRPTVTLLGRGEGYAGVVKQFDLNWQPNIDTSFLGVPLFNAIVQAANSSKADVAVIANADILLFDDFIYAVRKVNRDVKYPWMLIGARWDVSNVPEDLLRATSRRSKTSDRRLLEMVQYARENGTLHTYGGIDVWAWNTNVSAALYDGTMPHFVFGRGKYDNWFTHEVISAGRRHVVDASEACTLVHLLHDHHLVTDSVIELSANSSINQASSKSLVDKAESRRGFWNQGSRVKFELYINTYLAAAHGSYVNQLGTVLHAPLKLTSCYEYEGVCIFKRRRPHICRCEHSPFVPQAQSDPFAVNDSRLVFCGLLSSDVNVEASSDGGTLDRFVVSGRPRTYEPGAGTYSRRDSKSQSVQSSLHGALLEFVNVENKLPESSNSRAFGLPLLLDKLLEVVEHRTNSRRVVLTLLNSNYKSLLPRFACSARRAGIFDSLIVGALDDETYHYAITRGFAVYLEETVFTDSSEEASAIGARFGSQGFHVIMSLRTRLSRKLTNLGREVFYADPDVVFQNNPFDAVPASTEVAFLRISLRREKDGSSSEKMQLSTAMLYARPGRAADEALSRLEHPSVWTSPSGPVEALKGAQYTLLDATMFQNVPGRMPEKSARKGAVALHIACQGEVYRKIAVLSRATDLNIYNDFGEVCHLPQA